MKPKNQFNLLFISCLCILSSITGLANQFEENDSLEILIRNSDYSKAKLLLESMEPKLQNDSQRVEWLIEYSRIATIDSHLDIGLESIIEALNLSEKLNSDYLWQKANVQKIEYLRKAGRYEEGLALVNLLDTITNWHSIKVESRFYHRAAAVYNEYHYISESESDIQKAIEYTQQSLLISKSNNLLKHIVLSYNELGNITEKLGNIEQAKLYYDSSLQISKNSDAYNYAQVLMNKSSVFHKQQYYDSSIAVLKQALSVIADKKYYRMKSQLFHGLKLDYLAKGDSLSASRAEKEEQTNNLRLTESLLSSRVIELNALYASNEKDKVIEQTKKEIELQKAEQKFLLLIGLFLLTLLMVFMIIYWGAKNKNMQLAKLLKENNFLVGEANHRIKNNLQLIISLIGREKFKSQENKEKFQEISDKINSIATLHQQLYLDESKEYINIQSYLESVVNNFDDIFMTHEIQWKINIEEFNLRIDQALYLGLILTELITNSIKYAFKGKKNKKIKIKLKDLNHHQAEFFYCDNGVGLTEGKKPALLILLTQQLKATNLTDSINGFYWKIKFEK